MSGRSVAVSYACLVCLTVASLSAQGQPVPPTLAQIESDIAWLVNTERAQAGLPQLASDARLAEVARWHSEDMRDNGYVGHVSPVEEHRLPTDRYRAEFGCEPAALVENVARLVGVALAVTTAQRIHGGFMDSPEDRANLLDPRITHMGIGLATGPGDTLWATELFAKHAEPAAVGPGGAVSSAVGAQAQAADPEGVARSAAPLGVAPAARVDIIRLRLEPAGVRTASVTLTRGQFVRVGVSTSAPQAGLTLSLCSPEGEQRTGLRAVALAEAVPVLVAVSGVYTLSLTAEAVCDCRLIVISGSLSAVRGYGHAALGTQPLASGATSVGSLGDSGVPNLFTFVVQQPTSAELTIASPDPGFRAQLAVFTPDDVPVMRCPIAGGGPTRVKLRGLEPGPHLIVLQDPLACPGLGDYSLTLTEGAK